MANKWDDFHENMGDENAALHMSGAFDSEVGHDHDPTLPGRGAQISYNSLKDKPTSIANVTTSINGHAITDILESDGVTVKEATHAGSATNANDAAKLGNISASSYMRSADSGTYIDADVYPGISLVGILIDKSTQALTGIKRSTYQTSYTVPSGKILFYVKGFFFD